MIVLQTTVYETRLRGRIAIPTGGRFAARRGITLLEVLVAMLVLTIGVLGMAAIIPLGKLELAEGDISDNSSTVGRWAFRELSVRGYLRPEMWADPETGATVIGTTNGTAERYSLTPTNCGRIYTSRAIVERRAMLPPYVPIVIDPLMLAPQNFGATVPNSTDLQGPEQANRRACSVFPYSLSEEARQNAGDLPEGKDNCPVMPRFTLRTMPPSFTGPNPIRYTMRYDLASRIFRGTDDLNITLPDNDYRFDPVQQFAVNPNLADNNSKFLVTDGQIISTTSAVTLKAAGTVDGALYRKYLGNYSWFYIVEPSLSEMFVPTPDNGSLAMIPRTSGPYGSVPTTRQYRVWVVVCQQRDTRPLPDSTLVLPGENGMGERMVWVDFLDRGTVRLRVSGIKSESAALKALELRTNQWIAVLGRYEEPALDSMDNSKGQKRMRYVMEWYRVTGVADRPEPVRDTGVWYREATIAGRDFFGLGFNFFDDDNYAYEDGDSFDPPTGWGVLVKGTRGVYEKTIYNDGRSSWSMLESQ
jgi:hypothetical protein